MTEYGAPGLCLAPGPGRPGETACSLPSGHPPAVLGEDGHPQEYDHADPDGGAWWNGHPDDAPARVPAPPPPAFAPDDTYTYTSAVTGQPVVWTRRDDGTWTTPADGHGIPAADRDIEAIVAAQRRDDDDRRALALIGLPPTARALAAVRAAAPPDGQQWSAAPSARGAVAALVLARLLEQPPAGTDEVAAVLADPASSVARRDIPGDEDGPEPMTRWQARALAAAGLLRS